MNVYPALGTSSLHTLPHVPHVLHKAIVHGSPPLQVGAGVSPKVDSEAYFPPGHDPRAVHCLDNPLGDVGRIGSHAEECWVMQASVCLLDWRAFVSVT